MGSYKKKMKFLVLAVFGQSLAAWEERDSSATARGPQGASDADRTHMYNPDNNGYLWDWLSSVYASSAGGSYSNIYMYRKSGMAGLDANSVDATKLADYNQLYAWMHRISNAKIAGLTDDAWKDYVSCDGPACAGATTTTTTTATSTVTVEKSAECIEAENAVAKEENALAKGALTMACRAACANDEGATCGFLVNGISMILFALMAMLK